MSTKQPLFTIATITYNSAKWVRQAIESILSSSYQDFELLISDDCSTDDTWKVIQEYNDHRIRAYRNQINLGEYPNRNKVIKLAKGRYLLFVDGDDILYHDSLRNLSEYVAYFPGAGMFWGLNPQLFPFYVFPYQVEPEETMKLIYCTKIPISSIGFGEMLFKTDVLKSAGGLSEHYRIGDTYIKKKIALTHPVLFLPIGFMFWRQSPGQASKKIEKGLLSFFERVTIDQEIISSAYFPVTGNERVKILQNVRIGVVKLFIRSTILKGNIADFFRLMHKINLSMSDFPLLIKRGDYSFKPTYELGSPLLNEYNFIKPIKNE
jgi:glycosyltransferase involved in cell wall biosynthesis